MINLDTCKYLVWGYKNVYHTHGHIHEGFYRALKLSGKEVEWLDSADDLNDKDFSNTFIITNDDCVNNSYWPWPTKIKSVLPISEDCFYAVHSLKDNQNIANLLAPIKSKLSWSCFSPASNLLNLVSPTGTYDYTYDNITLFDVDTPFYHDKKHVEFRWATDLMPWDIEKNKPTELLSLKNKVINFVGTVWWVNEKELSQFMKACNSDGVEFKHLGGGQNGIISIEDNIKLIRESYMAPAISGSHHLTEGYVPCRIFKNISYGQYGITNSAKVNEVFGNRLIYNPDPYKLYFDAKEKLQSMKISELHDLMDFVAKKHTYLNRIDALMKAAKIVL